MADAVVLVEIVSKDKTSQGNKKAASGFKRLTQQIKNSSLAQIAAIGAVSAALQNTVQQFGAFDKKVREIGTLLDNVTEGQLKEIGEQSLKMAERFGQSVDEMATARYSAISSGFNSVADSMMIIEEASKLAVGGVSNVQATTALLTTTLNAYGKTAKDAQGFSDALFTTVKLGTTNIPELAKSLGQVASVANAAGLAFDDLGALVATGTQALGDTAQTVTGVRSALIQLTAPVEGAKKAMQDLKIETFRTAEGNLDLLRTIEQFQGMDIATIRRIIPDVEGAKTVLAVANNFKTLSANVEAFQEKAGANETAFEKMTKSVSFQSAQLQARLSAAGIKIGEALLPIAKIVTRTISAFASLSNESIQSMAKFAAAISGGILAIKGLSAAVALFSATAAVSPLGLLITGISAAAGIFFYLSGSISDAENELGDFQNTVQSFSLSAAKSELETVSAKIQELNSEQKRLRTESMTQLVSRTAKNSDFVDQYNERQRQRDIIANQREIDKLSEKEALLTEQIIKKQVEQRRFNEELKQTLETQRAVIDQALNSSLDTGGNTINKTLSITADLDAYQEQLEEIESLDDQYFENYVLKQIEATETAQAKSSEARTAAAMADFEALESQYIKPSYEAELQLANDRFSVYSKYVKDAQRLEALKFKVLQQLQIKHLKGAEKFWFNFARRARDLFVNQFGRVATAEVGRLFENFVDRQKTLFGKLFASIVSSFTQMLAQMAAEAAASHIFKLLIGTAAGGPAGGFGALLTSFFGNQGGTITKRGFTQAAPLQSGGLIKGPGINSNMILFTPKGIDKIPAMLAEGEMVLSIQQQKGLSAAFEKQAGKIRNFVHKTIDVIQTTAQKFSESTQTQLDMMAAAAFPQIQASFATGPQGGIAAERPQRTLLPSPAPDNQREVIKSLEGLTAAVEAKEGGQLQVTLNLNLENKFSAIDGAGIRNMIESREFTGSIVDAINTGLLKIKDSTGNDLSGVK